MYFRHFTTIAVHVCVLLGVMGAEDAISLTCPEVFQNNTINTITCVIDSSQFSGDTCDVTPSLVTFILKKKNEGSVTSLCGDTYPCGTTADPSDSKKCTCSKKEGDIFTYTFQYSADQSLDDGGTFTCTVCPADITYSQQNCDPITFGGRDEDNGGLTDGEKIGIGVGVTVGILLICGVIGFIVYNKLQRNEHDVPPEHDRIERAPIQGKNLETELPTK